MVKKIGKFDAKHFCRLTNLVNTLLKMGLFKQTIQSLQQINVKKCAGIRTHKHESSHITTRPGLPPGIVAMGDCCEEEEKISNALQKNPLK